MTVEFHRVFAHWKGSLWLGVPEYARRRHLSRTTPMVTLPVARQQRVCITLPDRRVLCDFGPEHDHDGS